MLLVPHRAMGTSQQEVEEHPTAVWEPPRANSDGQSHHSKTRQGKQEGVTSAWRGSCDVPWSPPQPWLVQLGRDHAVG